MSDNSRLPVTKQIFIYSTLMLVIILSIIAYVSSTQNVDNEDQLDKVVLQLRWSPQFQFSGYYASKLKGFYEEEGLDVEIRHSVDSSGEIINATDEVINGNADFGIGGVNILIANDKGANLSVVASIFQRSPVEYYMLEDTEFKSVLDFIKLGTARREFDLLDIELQAMLLSEGIDPFSDEFISNNRDLTINDLISREFDIIPGYLDTHRFNSDNKHVPIKSIKAIDYGIDFYGDSIFANNSLIESDPELVERFRRASLKGWEYALDNPDELIEYIPTIITKNKEIQNEIVNFNSFQAQRVLEYTLYPVVALGNINPHRWDTMNDTLAKLSLIKTSKNPDEYIFDYQKILDEEEAKTDQSFLTFLVFSFITILVAFLVHLSTKNALLESEISLNQKSQIKILRSKERYQAIFSSAVLGITITSKDGKILQSNDMWQKMIGYTDDELQNMNIEDLMLPEDKKRSKELMANLTLGEIDNYVEEKRYIKKNGGFFWGKLFMTSIYDQDVEKKVNIGMILDVTNVKIEEDTVRRSEERFRNIISDVANEIDDSRNLSYDGSNVFESEEDKNKLSLKLEMINLELERMFKNELDENRKKGAILIYQARLAAMGEMIGNIAHQWRQPLNNLGLILGNIEDAYNYDELNKEYMEKSIDKSMKLIKKMSSTIDDFRYFLNPKAEKSHFEVKASILDVFELLEENLRFNRIHVNMLVHTEEDDIKLSGFGYENQFSQAIFNIITNSVDALVASEFSENFINVDIYDLEDKIGIDIIDSGGGISEDIIENVFELYFTTKDVSKGTGLGLYMTKTIIENNLNGNIKLENTKNGLKTIISIPKDGE